MASEFTGPVLTKQRGGLTRRNPSTDNVFGLIMGGVTTTEYATLGEVVALTSASDADTYGWNAAYDANNSVLVRHHIDRFFIYNPDGQLYVMIVAQGTTLAAMCDKNNQNLLKLFTQESIFGKVQHAGVVLNPASGYTPTYTNGYEDDVLAAIPKAQELIQALASDFQLYKSGIVIEGRLEADATIATLQDFSTYASEGATIFSGAEPAVQGADTLYANYACVGSFLGMLGVRKVSESVGSTALQNVPVSKQSARETYPLTDLANEYWLSGALSSGKLYSELTEAEKSSIGTKRICYAGKYSGLDGYFISDSHTCTTFADDYAYIEDNRIWAKAATLVRTALLPIMKGEVEVDPATGFITASQIAYYQSRAQRALIDMVNNREIAGPPTIIIDPAQDVTSTSTVEMSLSYVRNGILRKLNGSIAATSAAS